MLGPRIYEACHRRLAHGGGGARVVAKHKTSPLHVSQKREPHSISLPLPQAMRLQRQNHLDSA